jgi:alkyl hydroperoxide reductase subunit F
MYDLIILGAGPAGVAAGVYAARKKINTLLISEYIGGQSMQTAVIENWIGDIKLTGFELTQKLENHLRAQAGLAIKTSEKIISVKKDCDNFSVQTDKNNYQTKTVIVATGAKHRSLSVAGEKELAGHGVAYCSTCDAPMFKDKTVAVVGTGNSGLEAVMDLLPYAQKIYLFDILDQVQGDAALWDKIKNSNQVETFLGASIKAIQGEKMVEKIIYQSNNEKKELAVQGVFVAIGMTPNSDCVKDLVKLNQHKEIEINHQNQAASVPGIFAAGDVTDVLYKQSSVAAGEGVKALLSVDKFIKNNIK